MTAAKPDHAPCAICESAAKVCDGEADHIRESERRAESRIVNNPRAVERRGQSVELPLVRAAAEIAVQRMVAEQCATAIRAACTHATPPRSDQPEPMVIFCPECKAQHIDLGEWATKPHRKHLCHSCGHVWKPHDHATVGVPIPAPPRSELADQLEALMREASETPWHFCDDGETSSCDDEYGRTVAHTAHHDAPHVKNAEANARLIVALVNALPEILTALRRTR